MRHPDGQSGRWFGRGGALWALLGAGLWASPSASGSPVPGVPSVATKYLRIVYEVNTTALPLESVALWYTTDLGQSWQLYGYDEDLRSPMPFEAPGEGLYGFYAVARNRVGESSGDPTSETEPLHQVLVDLTDPLLQAHSAALRRIDDRQILVIRWTAYDAHFGPRPITVEYSPAGDSRWRTMARGLPNDERYEWEVPRGVVGKIVVRLSARDSAGNVSTATFSPVEIELIEETPPEAELAGEANQEASSQESSARRPKPEPALLPPEGVRRVEALLAQARWHTERGEWALARQRLSELLTLAPDNGGALKALAKVDYRTGDYANALRAYHEVLRRHPDDRPALRGRALAEVAVRDYAAAAASLRRILESEPEDAETRLDLGDVLLMMGLREQARDMWARASRATSVDQGVATKAARRLQIYGADAR